MSRLRVHSFAISLDGYGAGPDQNLDNPLGRGGLMLHEWRSRTRTFQELFRSGGGETGVDNDFEARGLENVGAWILGRNMFAPIRGDWPDDRWRGWWGNNPPYHTDVFILTHHARAPIDMEGGTTFHFVTERILVALEKARSAAEGKDVRLGGGVSTIRQYLQPHDANVGVRDEFSVRSGANVSRFVAFMLHMVSLWQLYGGKVGRPAERQEI
jgi:dihydrofolate reductase